LRIDIATIFPEMFRGPLGASIISRAQEHGLVTIKVHDLRDYTDDRHRSVDDYPYGGGSGMVMRPEPFFRLVDALAATDAATKPWTILLSAAGRPLAQEPVRRVASRGWLLLLCGHYEGVDERVAQALADEEISIGDYILTGGELPAMVLVDAVVRLLPGVLGDPASLAEESFCSGLLEYPHYTRPAAYRGLEVPAVLTSGDHRAIAEWRRREAVVRTAIRRPELVERAALSPEELELVRKTGRLTRDR